MGNLIKIEDMHKSFYGVRAIDGMDFTMKEGEIRSLVGENGCGKSTMIKVISGYHGYDRGEMYINDKKYDKISPIESMDEGIQVIYQDFSLIPNMTVAENISMYYDISKNNLLINKREMRQRAEDIIKKLNFNINLDKYIHELGVAEKQMVAICRSLALDAKLIIMDEPTTTLTHKEVKNLFKIVKTLKEQGVGTLFVSHKLDEILEISDSITIMRNGKNVIDTDSNISREDLIYHMTGKKISDYRYEYMERDDKPLMEVKDYNLEEKFSNINFSLYKGEILGITGLLGCGRNELAKSLFGIEPASSGSVEINGQDIGIISSVQDALKYDIGFVPEDRLTEGLHLEQSIGTNAISRIIGRLVGKNGLLASKVVSDKKDELLSMIYIPNLNRENAVRSLSGGNQQKVVLAKWLAAQPQIFILNAPTVGVDIGAKTEIHNIIRNLGKEGIGVIVISDDIPEIISLCNRVLIMSEGQIVEEREIKDTSMEELEVLIRSEHEIEGDAI